jgi:hypothetical protein
MGIKLSENAKDRWHAFWRAATTPGLVIPWAVVLIIMFTVVKGMGGHSVIGGVCFLGPRGHNRPISTVSVIEIDGVKIVVDIEDPRRLALAERDESYPIAIYWREWNFFGVWAPTWESYSEEFRFIGYGRGARDDTPENRALIYDYLIAVGERPDPTLRTRNIHRLSGTIVGHLVNAVSLFALCAFYGSARRCFSRTMTTRQRRMLAGECPRCRYSITGLPTPVCPECGERLD